MWLHFILIGFLILSGIFVYYNGRSNNRDSIFLVITFTIFAILVGLRSVTVGNDTASYTILFNEISSTQILLLETRFEKGFIYLNKILSFIWDDPQILFIVASVIIMFSFAVFIKRYSDNIWLSVLIFFTFGYYSGSNNTIRQFIALSIVLWAYDYILKKKLLKFVVLIMIASQFHITAITFILAYPLANLKLSKKNIILFISIAAIGYGAFNILLNIALKIFPQYSYYVGSEYMTGGIRLASVMNFLVLAIIGVLFWGSSIRKYKFTKKGNITYNASVDIWGIYLIISILLTFISFKFNLIERFAEYFTVSVIITLPNIVSRIKNKTLKVLNYVGISIFFILYSTIILVYRPEWNQIYPYKFFWQ